MKASRQRPALAVGLAASAAVHAAVLAFGAIEVPLGKAPEIRLVRPAPLPAPEPAPDPATRVVVIRPPGVVPSGGAEGTRGGVRSASGARPPPAGRTVSKGPLAVPTPRHPSAPRASLALATPLAETGIPVVPAARDSAAATPEARPGRGIILRTGPASTGAGGGRVTGPGGAGGLGGFSAGGGVATAGPGGDCITPGIAGRDTPPRGPSALPGRSDRPGVTSRGPTPPSRRGGRPGG